MQSKDEILAKALFELFNKMPWSHITKLSGVHNVRRIADLDISPTISSWWKLHDAFPEDIPVPVLEDSHGRDYVVQNANKNSKSTINQSAGKRERLSPREQYFWDTFKKHGTDSDLDDFIGTLLSKNK